MPDSGVCRRARAEGKVAPSNQDLIIPCPKDSESLAEGNDLLYAAATHCPPMYFCCKAVGYRYVPKHLKQEQVLSETALLLRCLNMCPVDWQRKERTGSFSSCSAPKSARPTAAQTMSYGFGTSSPLSKGNAPQMCLKASERAPSEPIRRYKSQNDKMRLGTGERQETWQLLIKPHHGQPWNRQD